MGLIEVFYPRICVGCSRGGEYICQECQKKLRRPRETCPKCSQTSLGGWCHPKCRDSKGVERLITGLQYRGLVQQCLKRVKYKSAWEIIRFLYGLADWPEIEGGSVTYVPMWGQKERVRGFNQAELMAKLIAQSLKLPQGPKLERVRETKPMYGLTMNERVKNIAGAFKVITGITSGRVILIDDVWTTGATMNECARTLKQAGASEVWGVTLAR